MVAITENPALKVPFKPEDISPEHLVVAFLVHRFATLPKEALADLASLAPEFAKCDGDPETYREIVDTMREILFPELIGKYNNEGKAGSIAETENLRRRSDWIGKKIKEKRRLAKMTQSELAEESGLPQSHISRLEDGKHSPSMKTLERIAAALGIAVGELDPAN